MVLACDLVNPPRTPSPPPSPPREEAPGIGLFFDLRNPPRWQRPWSDFYGRQLDLIAEAEHQGADAVWFTEHHGTDDGYLSQPLTFAAAAAARTSRLRIGTAVLLAALRHPRHVAEEAAIVDLVSAGRLELGIGAGFVAHEYAAFGADLARRYRLTDAAVQEVTRLLGVVSPAPVQQPPPIWLGYQGPQGARRAGRMGTGLLSLERRLLEPYAEGLVEAGHDPAAARMGGLLDLIVAEDPERTLARILPHFVHQLNSYRRMHAGADPTHRDLTLAQVAADTRGPGRIPGLSVVTVEEAVATIRRRTAGLPVRQVYCWASVAGMPDDVVAEHVGLLLGSVAPAVRAAAAALPISGSDIRER